MPRWIKKISSVAIALFSISASAGFIELGASGNYRISRINTDNYQELISYTGSLAYYFWEMSAIELSYTQGSQVVVVTPDPTSRTKITTFFELIGADLVLTLADKQSFFQPYIKAGGAYTKKVIVREVINQSDRIPSRDGLVPSAGLGFKLNFTNAFSIKVGVDAWSSPPGQDPVTVDYAGRGGISWIF